MTLRCRIFLVGVPRSGTTLLQALLAAHDEVTSFTESHLFSRSYRFAPRFLHAHGPWLSSDPRPRLREFLDENDAGTPEAAQWFGPPTPRALRRRLLLPLHTPEVTRRLVAVLDGIAQDRQAAVWLEKTPRHLRALSLLERVCDDGTPTHFVHMVRDGLQTVASLHRASRTWERAYTVPECVRRWNADLKLTAARAGSPNHHLVLYESLTADPEAVLRPLLATLGLRWQKDILTAFATKADDFIVSAEHWKTDIARPIEPSFTAETTMEDEQRQQVAASLRQDLYDRVATMAMPHRSTEGDTREPKGMVRG